MTAQTVPLPVPPAKPKRKLPVVPILVISVAVGAGVAWLALQAHAEKTDDAQVEADIVAIAPRVGGQIARVPSDDDQVLPAGATIVQLDDSDYLLTLKAAEAERATAQANVQVAEAQLQIAMSNQAGGTHTAQAAVSGSAAAVQGADSQVTLAEATVARAQLELERATVDRKRAEQLVAGGAGSQERLDNARVAERSAQFGLAQAKASLAAAEDGRVGARTRVDEAKGRLEQTGALEAQVAVAQAGVSLARARLAASEAAVGQAQLKLQWTTVRAQQTGVVTRLNAVKGQLVTANQPLGYLVPQATYVAAFFKETQVGKMKAGQRAHLRVDAYPGRVFEGKVASLSGGTGSRFSLLPPDNASGNFVKVVQRVPVHIDWAQAPAVPVRPGMSVDVEVDVD